MEKTLSHNEKVQVVLPDMFLFFLAQPPRVNPHCEDIRQESESWLIDNGEFNARISKFIRQTDFSYFCAVVIPDALAETLRTLCDWGNWIFPFDDVFDNGYLKTNPQEAQRLIDGLVSIMDDENFETEHSLLTTFKSIWVRFCQSSATAVQSRFSRSMIAYCRAILQQVQLQSSNDSASTVEELLDLRCGSIATTPVYAFIEHACGLDFPDEVISHPSIQGIETVVTDIVLIQNDIVSYAKEMVDGENHNIVFVYFMQGKSLQSAFDCAGELLRSRYRAWYIRLTELPTWGETIDRQVQQYLGCLQNVALANVNWRLAALSLKSFPSHSIWQKGHINLCGPAQGLHAELTAPQLI